MTKKILMIAGPNGAGKTTMALELMADDPLVYEFINSDEIAKGLAPLHPESVALAASKLMIKRLQELLEAHQSFAFETTGAGTNYIKYLKLARTKGYEIHLTFLWLASPAQAVKRVIQRVKQGGHHVPEETIIRRYYLGLKNLLNYYLPLVDTALVMDNSLELLPKRHIAMKIKNDSLDILDSEVWDKIQRAAYDR
ncbi:MAG: AAA family ATPase [Rhabdochlamydiaceae bacterium]|jgi:predicted ABC-type ATPase